MTIFCHGMLMEGLVDIFATRMHQLSKTYSIYLSGKILATLSCTLYTNEFLLWIQEKRVLKNIISQSQNILWCRSLERRVQISQTEGKNNISKRMKLADVVTEVKKGIIYSSRFQNKLSLGDTFKTL